ncbi:MAG: hypothetical protein ABI212_13415 [Burkholderiaceae bacterium]
MCIDFEPFAHRLTHDSIAASAASNRIQTALRLARPRTALVIVPGITRSTCTLALRVLPR